MNRVRGAAGKTYICRATRRTHWPIDLKLWCAASLDVTTLAVLVELQPVARTVKTGILMITGLSHIQLL
jgi:hypothetical protein